ncbi:hypothetical protein MJO28_007883 [Puccinia striiformis f. sp. tritici]|uniref:Uncharacterized protein n=1 Tax=Puccinia striiformis f. sp. tritici TaxID=168172 RepID=A0ACC0EB50_9BASI|nr:hypothetical protein MJO28_007883 [Puccinia striiformis f. sp. tritici]
MPPCSRCASKGIKCVRTIADRACTACQKAKARCSAIREPLDSSPSGLPPVPAPAPLAKRPPPPIPPRPVRSLPVTTPSRSTLPATSAQLSTGFRRVVSVLVPQTNRGRRHNFSRTPSPFLKRSSVAGMVPRPSSISGASRPPKRRTEADPSVIYDHYHTRLCTEPSRIMIADAPLPELPPMPLRNNFDSNASAYQAAVIAWFDNRRVIQSYLGIPFDQPVPAFEDSVTIQFSQLDMRYYKGAFVISHVNWVTTVSVVNSPPHTAPVGPLDKGKERAVTPRPSVDSADNDKEQAVTPRPLVNSVVNDEEQAVTPRPSIDRRERTDTRAGSTYTDRDADGSSVDNAYPDDGAGPKPLVLPSSPIGENNYYGVPYDRPPPTFRSPAPLARPNTPVDPLHDLFPDCPQFARCYMPALIVNKFLRYVVALQWSAFTPSDRHNRYELFHHNCQLLRDSADNVIPFNNGFGMCAPQITPPSEATARPTSQVPVAEGEGDSTPCPNRPPTEGAHNHTPGPTRFRY